MYAPCPGFRGRLLESFVALEAKLPTLAPSVFKRFFLPGFAFKAIVIGGGYATGWELAEFFLPSGPLGGLLGMFLSRLLWSFICTVAFLFARAMRSYDCGIALWPCGPDRPRLPDTRLCAPRCLRSAAPELWCLVAPL